MAIAIETFLNPAKFTEELTSKLRDYKLPGIDVDAVVELGGADALDEHRDFVGRETRGLALGGDQLGPRTARGGVGAHDLMHHAE